MPTTIESSLPNKTILNMSGPGQLTTKALNNEYIRNHDDDNTSWPALILTLPHELLAEILELAIIPNNIHELSWRNEGPTYDPAVTLAVACTCRRFSQVIVSFNYRSINFSNPHTIVPTSRRLRLLARTFQSNPSLGLHCREFKMHIPDTERRSSQEDFEFVERILPFLPNIKLLFVHGGFGPNSNQQTWKLLRACVQHMRCLEILNLHRGWMKGLDVADVIREIQIPSLKEFYASGLTKSDSVACLGDFKTIKAASLTSIHLSDYSDSQEALEKLLSWPKCLSKFTLTPFESNLHYIDLPMIKQMLFQHRESLTDLDIGYLSADGAGKLAHWSEFPNLENLTLSRLLFESSREYGHLFEFKDELADYILAPRLKRFTLAFTIIDQHWEQWDEFGPEEETWIRRLAQVALERKAPLQEIRIRFNPEWDGPYAHNTNYPWDQMDALNKEFQTQGIIITYTKPPVTRAEWSTGHANRKP